MRQKKTDASVNATIDSLRSMARGAVISTFQQWREHPHRYKEYGSQYREPTFEEARGFVLGRSRTLEEYPSGIDSFGSLHWVFTGFEDLASHCGQLFRTLSPSLMEYGALIRAMVNLERYVELEKCVWEEFRMRTDGPNSPLPAEAGYNLLVIAEVAVRLADVLGSKEFEGDSEYEARRQFAPEVIRRSNKWSEWR